ncbi:MAG: hypothetical protein LBM08_06565, partial [Dysgonamonadaceae bacterium]|nr:hypothetical protein [Dysgonamonadaceae bacterium]
FLTGKRFESVNFMARCAATCCFDDFVTTFRLANYLNTNTARSISHFSYKHRQHFATPNNTKNKFMFKLVLQRKCGKQEKYAPPTWIKTSYGVSYDESPTGLRGRRFFSPGQAERPNGKIQRWVSDNYWEAY